MSPALATFVSVLEASARFKYLLIFLITIVEGPAIMIFSGFLARVGFLYWLWAYLALMLGDLVGDALWYLAGRRLGMKFVDRFGKFFSLDRENVDRVSEKFHDHKNSILLVNKLTMGFGFTLVTLFTAGMVKIPFKRFIALNALGQTLWTAFLMSVGYSFGSLFQLLNTSLDRISLFAMVVMIALLFFGFGKYAVNTFFRN